MQTFLRFTVFILFAIGSQLLGCVDTPPDIMEMEAVGGATTVQVETLGPGPIVTEPPRAEDTAEDTFVKLRRMFPNAILDDALKTLREVTRSQPYLDFLTQESPIEEPFQTFDEYLEVAPPDVERYLPFLKKRIGAPTDEDIETLHRMTVASREANFILYRQDFDAQDVWEIFEKKFEIFSGPLVEGFLKRHQLKAAQFAEDFEPFVVQTETIDARWLHEQFEEHGVDEGLLWGAIGNPVLIGELLQNLSNPNLFLRWVDEKREP